MERTGEVEGFTEEDAAEEPVVLVLVMVVEEGEAELRNKLEGKQKGNKSLFVY